MFTNLDYKLLFGFTISGGFTAAAHVYSQVQNNDVLTICINITKRFYNCFMNNRGFIELLQICLNEEKYEGA